MSRRKGTSRAPPDLIIAASLRRREPELARGPRQRDLRLATLELADARRGGRWRQAGAGRKVACEQGCESLAVGDELPRVGPAFELKARQPADDVEERIADVGEVPVHEDGAALLQAEVVAADVEVQERFAGEHARSSRLQQTRKPRFQPRRRAEPRREKRLRVFGDELPAVQPLALGRDWWQIGRRRGVQLVQGGANGVELPGRPGRRPVRVAQAAARAQRPLAAVPAAELGDERRLDGGVAAVLLTPPFGRSVVKRELDERM